jgi:hypothetical protein
LRHAARSTWRIAAFTSCTAAGERKLYIERVASVPLLIINDLGMRKPPATAAEDLLEIVMRRYERTLTMLTSNRPVEDLVLDREGVANSEPWRHGRPSSCAGRSDSRSSPGSGDCFPLGFVQPRPACSSSVQWSP